MKPFRIGALSRRTGVHVETIRYYERIGLIPEPPRAGGRFRSYDDGDVARLGFIRRCRELGFSLDEIRDLQALAQGGAHSCAEAARTARRQLAAINGKLKDLRRMQKTLQALTRNCVNENEPAPACPMLETLMQV